MKAFHRHRRVTVSEMATIHKEIVLGLEPTLMSRDARTYRKELTTDLKRIAKDGNVAVMPVEWPDEPTKAEAKRMDADIAFGAEVWKRQRRLTAGRSLATHE